MASTTTTRPSTAGVHLTTIVPAPLLEKVRAIAAREQLTMSAITRRALHKYVEAETTTRQDG